MGRREGRGRRGGRRKELRRDESGDQGPGPKQREARGPGVLRHPNCPHPPSCLCPILSLHPPILGEDLFKFYLNPHILRVARLKGGGRAGARASWGGRGRSSFLHPPPRALSP